MQQSFRPLAIIRTKIEFCAAVIVFVRHKKSRKPSSIEMLPAVRTINRVALIHF